MIRGRPAVRGAVLARDIRRAVRAAYCAAAVFAIGAMNCGSVSQGNRIQVSWETSVMKVSTAGLPAGFA